MRPRGRPRLDAADPSVNANFRLPSKQYDLMVKEAERAKLPVAGWLRRMVEEACRRKTTKV
jgi:hypothetical protein